MEDTFNALMGLRAFEDNGHLGTSVAYRHEALKKYVEQLAVKLDVYRQGEASHKARVQQLELQIQSFERRLSEAVNSRCSCGGAGPGEGCDWCNLYHHVKGTVKREGVPTKCPRCGIMPAHHSGMCDECYEKMVREGGT